jgi:hypothetical protein
MFKSSYAAASSSFEVLAKSRSQAANDHAQGHIPTTLPPEIDLSPQVAELLGG